MKFRQLTIHNIASIEHAVIDFDAQPLADSEVFLITGKTGAGKSTILDAICLALYANAPRLENTKMQGVTIDVSKEVKIDDPRQLMRRHTTEAHVSLTFTGSNGVDYKAVWAVARAYGKINGHIKSKTWELTNLHTHFTLTKDAEIRKEMKAAVGLDFSQFCRTTMLAQGEFSRFLNSKDDEKAAILEKITGVDVYSKIGAKVYELTGQKRLMWDEARSKVEVMHTLTEEELAQKNRHICELESQQQRIRGVIEQETAKRNWLLTDEDLSKEVSEQQANMRQASERVASEEFRAKEMLVKEWSATIEVRRWMTEMEQARKDQSQWQKELDDLADDYAGLLGGFCYAQRATQQVANEVGAIEQYLGEEQDRAPVYEKAQTIVGYLTAVSKGREQITQSVSAQEKILSLLNKQLLPAFNTADNKASMARKTWEQQEQDVRVKENELAAFNLPRLRRELEETKEQLNHIKSAKEHIETLNVAKEQRMKMERELDERLVTIEKKQKQKEELTVSITEANLKMTIRKEDLDRQKDSIHKFASAWRQKLRVGEVCPVCRQKIVAALPQEEELATMVNGLQEELIKAETTYKHLVEMMNRLDAEIKTEQAACQRDRILLRDDTTVNRAEERVRGECRACGIGEMDGATTLMQLDRLQGAALAKREELEQRIKVGETDEEAVRKLRHQLDNERKTVEALLADVQQKGKEVEDSKRQLLTIQELIRSKKQEIATAIQEVEQLIGTERWEVDWNASPMEFAEALTLAARTYADRVKRKQMFLSQLEKAKVICQNVATQLDAIVSAMPSWKNIRMSSVERVDHLLDQTNNLMGKVMEERSRLKTAEEAYKQNHALLNEFLADNTSLSLERLMSLHQYSPNEITSCDDELKRGRERVVSCQTLLDKAVNQQMNHRKNQPVIKEEDTPEHLLNTITDYEKQQQEIGEQKGALMQELRVDAANREKLGTLIQEANDKRLVYEQWARLNQLIGNASGSTFRKIAQSYVLASLIHSANSYMQTLSDRYTLKVTPGTFVISIVDAYQGYVSRAASTISGGESFLVSLSLALALSDIGQQWQVDTLFIDEGFGTLSGEPLQRAVETLRSLHSKAGRHVGIISHIEELRERIPVQIQVNQEGYNSCSSVRVVPTP